MHIICIQLFSIAFVAHQNAVFDICWVPDKCQLITGSGDHNAALWDMTSCKLVSIFKKHSSSIKSIDVCREQSGKLGICFLISVITQTVIFICVFFLPHIF